MPSSFFSLPTADILFLKDYPSFAYSRLNHKLHNWMQDFGREKRAEIEAIFLSASKIEHDFLGQKMRINCAIYVLIDYKPSCALYNLAD